MLVFGQGDFGQLGLGEDVTEKMRPAAISDYQDVVGIAAGAMHNVCLRKTGEVLTFGCNDEGALGRDTTKEGSETVPGVVDLPDKAVQVTAGDSHTAALLDDGRVFAWGTFRVYLFYQFTFLQDCHRPGKSGKNMEFKLVREMYKKA